jgi:perosamine synthetase
MAVHLFGHPADMDEINRIARKHKLLVVEDACQAHGALYKGRKVGSLSKAACFSFSGAKVITTGEGGMIITNDKNLTKRIISINTDYVDEKRKFYHSDIGYNLRLTNLQAALGLAQLENIQKFLNMKIRNANLYSDLLKDQEIIQLPPDEKWAKSVFWLYSIVLRKNNLRDKMMDYLSSKGIETRPFFVPMHKLPMYKNNSKFPNSDYLGDNGICLPSGAGLKESEIEFISKEVKTFIKKYG